MQKILLFCIIAVIILFQYQLYYGHGGDSDDARVKHQIVRQAIINHTLETRNASMADKINTLEGSNELLEARARSSLNLIKHNETLVTFPNESQ